MEGSTKFFVKTTINDYPMVILVTQRSTFVDAPYCDMPYPHNQLSPINDDSIFEERFQQALDMIELYNQYNNQILQSLKELET